MHFENDVNPANDANHVNHANACRHVIGKWQTCTPSADQLDPSDCGSVSAAHAPQTMSRSVWTSSEAGT